MRMEIKTIGQLKDIIKRFDDDFKLEVDIMIEIPEEELIKSRWPYPWRKEDGRLEFNDVGYSENVVCFGVYRKENEDARQMDI